ncbi:CRISPR-associated protein Cmr5 [Pseudothermotoga hypogea DSM 11164 = NBRC 106472]|uniref:CRISPR type III-B/RAMP module-associated protein Cmr5 n=1 Tax=Pseudothermotoga hypogea DSM 11164 = NBRC 106472 TaxID=1123384 RepID=A0A0X1KR83_9THEM|nr:MULTISPECIES: type III-B CRISPR module-associated protein Cmr5 [Pseudothermotoga]AJC73731.1 CRISPR-associated protein Cmr5 [Pseudothermotoga hypogea DSM 11164 = NBRC 106472]MBC7123143.1 type III-B CRISPR module-associated protein Cmr5 [Pseudothermotoga sp.]MDI6862977.1 type III-B CRISPR module-associated protein Cmr5 [Pseudothermotoga sp.]
MRNLELEMARRAMEKVKEVANEAQSKQEYLTLARKLGSMIIQNGLIGTITYLKNKSQGFVILGHLYELVSQQIPVDISKPESVPERDYFKVQAVALEASKWLKRYAEILLKE